MRFGESIFDVEQLVVPINHRSAKHWTGLIVYMQEKRIQHYDGYRGSGEAHLKNMLRFLGEAHDELKRADATFANKHPGPFEYLSWKLVPTLQDFPKQEDNYNCGVIFATAAYTAGAGLTEMSFDAGTEKMNQQRHKFLLMMMRKTADLKLADEEVAQRYKDLEKVFREGEVNKGKREHRRIRGAQTVLDYRTVLPRIRESP